MFVFDEVSTKLNLTPWGVEVKKRLIDRGLKQQDLVTELSNQGFKVSKIIVSKLLYGIGVSARGEEIKVINHILDIQ